MNARVLTAVVVAAVVVLATAEPLVQVRKGATPLADGKPNTFRVDLAFRVVEAACAVMNTMATFPEAAIDDGYLTEIREKDSFTV